MALPYESATSGERAPFIIVYPRGQLTELDKARLESVGVIAIEADDPKSVVQMHLTHPLVSTQMSGDAIVLAALQSIAEQTPETSGGSITVIGRAAHAFIRRLASSLEGPKP